MSIIQVFKSFSDETRLRIIRILFRGNFHVNEILFITGSKQSNISHHLKILLNSGLIRSKKEGALTYYLIDENRSNNMVFDYIRSCETELELFAEDMKRLEIIHQQRKQVAEDYFNHIGEKFDYIQDRLLNGVYDVADVVSLYTVKMDRVLDIGCGTGRNLPVLQKCASQVIGIDVSPKMVQLAEHTCKTNKLSYELKVADSQSIPLESSSVDGVFMNMVLHHISDTAHSIKEMARVLRVGGEFILIDLLKHNNEAFQRKYADLWLGFKEDELISWLERAGFEIISKEIKESTSQINPLKIIIILARKIKM